MEFAQIAASGPLLAALAVAVLAGLVSFFAPCMLPLVPGYLATSPGSPEPTWPPRADPAPTTPATRAAPKPPTARSAPAPCPPRLLPAGWARL